LEWQLKSYGVVKISAKVQARCQPLSMQQNLPKIAVNYPKLPKSAQRQLVQETLNLHQKLRFWYFPKKTSMCRGGTKVCACHLDFQYKNFPYAFFNVKNGLCMWISATHLYKMTFFSRFYTICGYEILLTNT
jgi:hypothetical protein